MLPQLRFFAVAMLLCVSACGFHLKGNLPHAVLPVNTWSVQGDVLQSHLESALRHNQASVNPNAQAQIKLLHYETKKDIYTITRAAKLNEYLLSMRIVVQAYRGNRAWGEPISLQIQRIMPYADSMILGKQYEEEQIWQEMQHDAAQQIVRQMAFLKDE
ncbi:LPS-assembly lipoprotein LptE [Alysiella filiformis]|uniref:LPS-assembly lipoprotein LptE n=1 Tax=Alysiella filiformis DSM 16848 TaxID=1120981 RepID=A0A286EJX4_9NEIS|nr:LPS assembly lipoprotein LptE [Alysiella filiformis]QMT30698.1 hypothetical protein H3L97_08080 [Alysiella filiformis]UBQ56322.1 LPS assembly lipoprotein LptE [Alysiella filiformis DSM 16848]SOD71206.1 LPS-assembly lipoprotein [Alysiella filiformis DSM 16848]